MPDIANLVVKKNDNVTDVTWTKFQASSGDRSPAIWRNLNVGSTNAQYPTYSCQSRPAGTRKHRIVTFQGKWPQLVTNTTTGVTSIVDQLELQHCAFKVPDNMPVADVNEAIAQFMNLLAHSLSKQQAREGYAAS